MLGIYFTNWKFIYMICSILALRLDVILTMAIIQTPTRSLRMNIIYERSWENNYVILIRHSTLFFNGHYKPRSRAWVRSCITPQSLLKMDTSSPLPICGQPCPIHICTTCWLILQGVTPPSWVMQWTIFITDACAKRTILKPLYPG